MRIRKLDANGEPMRGHGPADFVANNTETVALLGNYRLSMQLGEWYLDRSDGMPYLTKVLGNTTTDEQTMAISDRVLGTQGVREIDRYFANRDRDTRSLTITVDVSSIYGATTLTTG